MTRAPATAQACLKNETSCIAYARSSHQSVVAGNGLGDEVIADAFESQ